MTMWAWNALAIYVEKISKSKMIIWSTLTITRKFSVLYYVTLKPKAWKIWLINHKVTNILCVLPPKHEYIIRKHDQMISLQLSMQKKNWMYRMSILTNNATISSTIDKFQTIDIHNMEEKPSFASSSILDLHISDSLLYNA